jgi:hypothetical protein
MKISSRYLGFLGDLLIWRAHSDGHRKSLRAYIPDQCIINLLKVHCESPYKCKITAKVWVEVISCFSWFFFLKTGERLRNKRIVFMYLFRGEPMVTSTIIIKLRSHLRRDPLIAVIDPNSMTSLLTVTSKMDPRFREDDIWGTWFRERSGMSST